ncbi:uncharacterized protein E0L32_007514 [Thyridium curvatum]|uniref:Zn(2)-C6 fungal-type domain-containing protein n=1 Tax=Thyridium curvatum TaxID=1093900 RepID=A0A507AWD1_9PEZI|nr:uncharacterized protein E0L32_007514 [Thyridium curvatum]TPX11777.1 hypothetical protein E0L32_007514 [Thyridium curvatum]
MRPHIVPVCDRCRRRKQKCDTELKPCSGCISAGVECVMTDPETEEVVPRTYVLQLESHVATLEKQLAEKRIHVQHSPCLPVHNLSATNIPESVSVLPGSRYLGASSGFAFVESALRLAYKRGILESIPGEEEGDDVSTNMSKRHGFDDLLPVLQSPSIPERPRMIELFDLYDEAQWQYLILTESEFDAHLDAFYRMDPMDCPISAVVVYMVFAIAVQHVERTDWNVAASNVASSYHQQALGMVGLLLRHRSIESLQAILLVLVFSINNPQKPIVWHLLGSAMRLASNLNLHIEPEDVSTRDISHRLFWSLYSMDRAIGNTLGRPTILEDGFITSTLPMRTPFGLGISLKETRQREIAAHCFRIRQIQSEVADTLYQKLRQPSATFFADMQTRLQEWHETIPPHAASAPHILDWFHHSYFNVTMFIHRPSPVNPQPSTEHLNKCFEAAGEVLQFYSKIHSRGGFDATWMAVHWLFLAAITHLFCLWTDEDIRRAADWAKVNDAIQSTGMVLSAMTERWSSGRKMPEIYRKLSSGTLAKYTTIGRLEDKPTTPSQNLVWEEFQQQNAQLFSLDDMAMDFDMQFWIDMQGSSTGTTF